MERVEELTLSPDETIRALIIADKVLSTANRQGSVGTELPVCLIKDLKLTHLKAGTRCAAATGFFVIGPEGHVRVCNHSPRQLVHVSDILSLKSDPYWRRFVFKEYLPEPCASCGQTFRCDGGCREAAHVYNGDPAALDPLFDKTSPTELIRGF